MAPTKKVSTLADGIVMLMLGPTLADGIADDNPCSYFFPEDPTIVGLRTPDNRFIYLMSDSGQ